MTFPTLTLVTLMIGAGSYLAFGPRIAGFFLLCWAALHVAGHALGRR